MNPEQMPGFSARDREMMGIGRDESNMPSSESSGLAEQTKGRARAAMEQVFGSVAEAQRYAGTTFQTEVQLI